MDPRKQLEMIQRDMKRLEANRANIAAAKNNDDSDYGITVTTTIGGKTRVARSTQMNMGNVSVSLGCMDGSRKGDQHVPDGTYVDGVKLDEETDDEEENEYIRKLKRDLKKLQEPIVIRQETPSTPQFEEEASVSASNSTTKIVSIVGNQRVEGEIKRGQAFTLETSLRPGENVTRLNIDHDVKLFGSNSLTGTRDLNGSPSHTPSGPGRR